MFGFLLASNPSANVWSLCWRQSVPLVLEHCISANSSLSCLLGHWGFLGMLVLPILPAEPI